MPHCHFQEVGVNWDWTGTLNWLNCESHINASLHNLIFKVLLQWICWCPPLVLRDSRQCPLCPPLVLLTADSVHSVQNCLVSPRHCSRPGSTQNADSVVLLFQTSNLLFESKTGFCCVEQVLHVVLSGHVQCILHNNTQKCLHLLFFNIKAEKQQAHEFTGVKQVMWSGTMM